MKLYSLLQVFLVILCLSCEEKPAERTTNWRIDGPLVAQLQNGSGQSITIDEKTFELHAYLWRDFQPISPPDGKELLSINWLVDTDSVNVPNHIALSEQFVIHGDSIWTANYTDEKRQSPPYVQERVSRNGPKWGPDLEVTVIAKVTDLSTGAGYYLRRDHVTIGRTD